MPKIIPFLILMGSWLTFTPSNANAYVDSSGKTVETVMTEKNDEKKALVEQSPEQALDRQLTAYYEFRNSNSEILKNIRSEFLDGFDAQVQIIQSSYDEAYQRFKNSGNPPSKKSQRFQRYFDDVSKISGYYSNLFELKVPKSIQFKDIGFVKIKVQNMAWTSEFKELQETNAMLGFIKPFFDQLDRLASEDSSKTEKVFLEKQKLLEMFFELQSEGNINPYSEQNIINNVQQWKIALDKAKRSKNLELAQSILRQMIVYAAVSEGMHTDRKSLAKFPSNAPLKPYRKFLPQFALGAAGILAGFAGLYAGDNSAQFFSSISAPGILRATSATLGILTASGSFLYTLVFWLAPVTEESVRHDFAKAFGGISVDHLCLELLREPVL